LNRRESPPDSGTGRKRLGICWGGELVEILGRRAEEGRWIEKSILFCQVKQLGSGEISWTDLLYGRRERRV
jgi:hypothetical protein